MAERTYADLVHVVKDYLNASPDAEMTLTEAVQSLDKDMRRKGFSDTYANYFMVEFAAFIDRNKPA